MTKRKEYGRGGKREGSGRPRQFEEPTTINFKTMNINQIAQELYGNYFADLNPSQQDEVWTVYDRRTKAQ